VPIYTFVWIAVLIHKYFLFYFRLLFLLFLHSFLNTFRVVESLFIFEVFSHLVDLLEDVQLTHY